MQCGGSPTGGDVGDAARRLTGRSARDSCRCHAGDVAALRVLSPFVSERTATRRRTDVRPVRERLPDAGYATARGPAETCTSNSIYTEGMSTPQRLLIDGSRRRPTQHSLRLLVHDKRRARLRLVRLLGPGDCGGPHLHRGRPSNFNLGLRRRLDCDGVDTGPDRLVHRLHGGTTTGDSVPNLTPFISGISSRPRRAAAPGDAIDAAEWTASCPDVAGSDL